MSLIDKVLAAAKSIQDSGKQPSLALIKARVGGSVPMPILIQGLQTFRDMPETEKTKLNLPQSPTTLEVIDELSLEYLNRKIEQLEQQIIALSESHAAMALQLSGLQQDKE